MSEDTKLKILLLSDMQKEFNDIADTIIKYNPYPDKIVYTKNFITEMPIINYNEWHYVYLLSEDRSIPISRTKMIRGCYFESWQANPSCGPIYWGSLFSACRAVIFANNLLEEKVSPFLKNTPRTVIYTSLMDESAFSRGEENKQQFFSSIFVDEVKNLSMAQKLCAIANVNLIVASSAFPSQIAYEYSSADICFSLSPETPLQTFVESAICGVPMLTSNDNILSKKIPCFAGTTESDFIAILHQLKQNRQLCQRKGEDARQTVLKNFTGQAMAKKFADFFCGLHKQDTAKIPS